MALIEKFLASIEELKSQVATDSLTNLPDAEKTAFGFGKAVGRLEGVRLVETLFQNLLQTQDEKRDPDESRPGRRTRT